MLMFVSNRISSSKIQYIFFPISEKTEQSRQLARIKFLSCIVWKSHKPRVKSCHALLKYKYWENIIYLHAFVKCSVFRFHLILRFCCVSWLKIIYKWTLSTRICRLAFYNNGKMDPYAAQPKRYTAKEGGGRDSCQMALPLSIQHGLE